MQINRHRFRTLGISLIAVLLLLATGYFLMVRMIDLDTYKEQILAELRKSLNRPVTYKSGRLTFSFGPAVSFENVLVKERDGSENFAAIDSLTCRIELLPLLGKQIVVHGLVADRPVIRLERYKDGTFNVSDLLEPAGGKEVPLRINQLRLRNGDITVIDRMLQPEPLVTRFAKVDLTLDNIGRAKKTGIRFSTALGEGASGSLSLTGKLRMSPQGTPLGKSILDADVVTKQLDLGHFWPYYRQYVPFKKILGKVDTESEFHGQLAEFTSSGRISLSSLRFDYQPVFKQALTPKSLKIKYNLELNKADISIKAIEVTVDGAEVRGSCAIRDYKSGDPRIVAQAVTADLDLAKYQQYIPYGIIVKHVASWIEEHIKGGIYHLEDGRLDGKVSQILHMEKGENYNVLYIKASVEKGVVSYGSTVPTFNNIKGILEMKGKDFFLHNMSGNFGASPLTLEGRITDYPIDTPSGYPFRMTISPGKSEIAWLLGKNRASRFSCSGNSSLSLAGDGFTSGYNLSGSWNLTPISYSYANLVNKPVGTSSAINFRGSINQKEANLTSFHYTLGGLALDLSAKYPFAAAQGLDLLINTNPVNIESIAAMSPLLSRYQPSGRAQLTVRGVTADAAADDYRWKGVVALTNAAFRYSPTAFPLSALTGTVSFNDNALETSQLTARVGSSTFSGKGAISSLNPVAFTTSFASPRIDLTDFGFVQQNKMPQISKVRGEVSLSENNLTIKSLSGTVNSSQMTIKGVVTDLAAPKADLAIGSSYLDISDILLLDGLEKKAGPASGSSPPPAIRAALRADRGIFSGTPFEKLFANISLANRVVQIQPLEADILGGKLTAKGIIAATSPPQRLQFNFMLTDASAAEVIQLVAVDKKELTGTMSIEGEMTARGETADSLKKTAAGSVKFHARNGSMRRFSALSKVFSILNVSQLFKLKLPDMVSEGMPYNDIKGTMTFRDGIVSTNDLFVASNAMNMSMVGKHDYINDNLDFTLGIQPLQTIDKVVSHIPIVGWILTGKEKTLITTYFEIKGKSDAPKVSAIPVKALGKGVLGIFKRVFQLPSKLVTDTGEVILGN
jgi:uncharacterized protein YhdP